VPCLKAKIAEESPAYVLRNSRLLVRYSVFAFCCISFLGCATNPRYKSGESVLPDPQAKKPHHRTAPPAPAQGLSGGSSQRNYHAKGLASWYGGKFHGRKTASGERFNQYGLTAAHRTLPFGALVKVTNVKTGESVVVRINDRGPHIAGRIIDLSYGAAKKIGLLSMAMVEIEVVR
jgi:rare lipoprotein A (peptidoglycan hydrolase)